jgi:hypothetical protein
MLISKIPESFAMSPSAFTNCSINVSSAQAIIAGLPIYLA